MKSCPVSRTGAFSLLVGCLLLAAAPDPAGALDVQKESSPVSREREKAPFKVTVPVSVVIVSAVVTDQNGEPVKDLKATDFSLFEDGKPQPIQTFSTETSSTLGSVENAGQRETQAESVAEASREAGPNQPRVFALLIDDVTGPDYSSLYRATEAMRKYIAEDLQPGDQVGIFAASGRVQVAFTDVRQQLLEELESLVLKLDRRPVAGGDCVRLTETQAEACASLLSPSAIPRPEGAQWSCVLKYMQEGGTSGKFAIYPPEVRIAIAELMQCSGLSGQVQGVQEAAAQLYRIAQSYHAESQFRRRQALTAVRRCVRAMRHFDARKSLILFSEGFLSDAVQYELQQTVDASLRAGIVVDAVDIRGLFGTGIGAGDQVSLGAIGNKLVGLDDGCPCGEPCASGRAVNKEMLERDPLGQATFLSEKPRLLGAEKLRKAESLRQLADETGGMLFQNNNDLQAGIRQIAQHESAFYVMSYACPSTKADGRYHRIRVELKRPGLKLVSYRKGYYSPRELVSSDRRRVEEIKEALHVPGDLNEIPIRLSYACTALGRFRYQLTLKARVNVTRMEFANEESRRRNTLDLVVLALDESGKVVDGQEKSIELNLSDSTYRALAERGLVSTVEINVPPGRYQIKAVARETLGGRMGSSSRVIQVP